MYIKVGTLYDKDDVKQCEIVALKRNMFQVIKVSDSRNKWACTLNEAETKRYKRMNKLFYQDELQRMRANG